MKKKKKSAIFFEFFLKKNYLRNSRTVPVKIFVVKYTQTHGLVPVYSKQNWENFQWFSSRSLCKKRENSRYNCPEVFCKKSVLKNFTKLSGKHLRGSLFFNKVAGVGNCPSFCRASYKINFFLPICNRIKNRDPKFFCAVMFQKLLKMSSNSF